MELTGMGEDLALPQGIRDDPLGAEHSSFLQDEERPQDHSCRQDPAEVQRGRATSASALAQRTVQVNRLW
jgi:hypothetical protein